MQAFSEMKKPVVAGFVQILSVFPIVVLLCIGGCTSSQNESGVGRAQPNRYVMVDKKYIDGNLLTVAINPQNGHGEYGFNAAAVDLLNDLPQPETRFVPGSIVNFFDFPKEYAFLVEGYSFQCPVRYVLITFLKAAPRAGGTYIGGCSEVFDFTSNGAILTGTEHAGVDPLIFTYEFGRVSPLIHQSRLKARPVANLMPNSQKPPPPTEVAHANDGNVIANLLGVLLIGVIAVDGYELQRPVNGLSDHLGDCPTRAVIHGFMEAAAGEVVSAAVSGFANRSGTEDIAAKRMVEGFSTVIFSALLEGGSLKSLGKEVLIEKFREDHPGNAFEVAWFIHGLDYYSSCVSR